MYATSTGASFPKNKVPVRTGVIHQHLADGGEMQQSRTNLWCFR